MVLPVKRPIDYAFSQAYIDRKPIVQNLPSRVQLAESEAACLEAVRRGLDRKTKIALEVKRDLKAVSAALENLKNAKLIRQGLRRYSWRTTKLGQSCVLEVVPGPKRARRGSSRGRIIAGSAAEGLLVALDRPRRGAELLDLLAVTRQRLHQLIVRFHAEGRLRIGDPVKILHIVARSDDPSVLLSRDEERVLSAVPEETSTTQTRLAAAVGANRKRTRAAIMSLCDKGLIEASGSSRRQSLYRLSLQGRAHFQRGNSARVAEPAPLAVRSARARAVLSYIAERGELRIRDVRDALGIPNRSANALMQYLKRKDLVRKVGRTLYAPYALTPRGHETLEEMERELSTAS